jgi:hypothetical protein
MDRRLRNATELALSQIHPCLFLRHVHCVDNTTGDDFNFHFSPEQLIRYASTPNPVTKAAIPEDLARKMIGGLVGDYEETGWEWQGDLIDWWMQEFITAILKARQLGITWCASGVGLWYITMVPGTRVLCQSIGEPEAKDIIDHAWEMYLSLQENHPHLVKHLKLMQPTNGRRPHMDIVFEHPGGKTSRFNAMPSTSAKGHGRTASFVIMDEFARHPYARESYKAIVPTLAGSKKASGRTAIISTGNGISTDEDGGNFFHHVWTNARHYGVQTRFLRWDQNPDRDQDWYQRVAMKLPNRDRGEQYPNNEREAFILTGDAYFQIEDLDHYLENLREPLYRMDWEVLPSDRQAKRRISDFGSIDIYLEPQAGHSYAIGCDISTGYGRDFSSAFVIDLASSALVAELHGRADNESLAEQLHYLGRWYNTAKLALEKGGGWGDAVMTALRDGKNLRPPYPNLYRHRQPTSVGAAEMARVYGFPMANQNRNLIVGHIEQALRERTLPWMTRGLIEECSTFVYRGLKKPSPAAQEGCNDDRVLACGIALEMFRQFGTHPGWRPKRRVPLANPYPWR